MGASFGVSIFFYLDAKGLEMSDSSISKARPSIGLDAQIDLLERHGVGFDICSREDARDFLERRSYFFKLKAFDNLFVRDDGGKYLDLDFAYLKDVASLDFHIRQFALSMVSEIEHAVKVRFNALLMRRTSEDGYALVADFDKSQRKRGRSLLRLLGNVYTQAIVDKYGERPPAWLIWETTTFNTTIDFYRFFLERSGYEDSIYGLLTSVRILRNAASHHNCVLVTPREPIVATRDLGVMLEELMADAGCGTELHVLVCKWAQRDPLCHDIASMLCCHINLVSGSDMMRDAFIQIERLIQRIDRHHDWYGENAPELRDRLLVVKVLLDAFVRYSRRSGAEKRDMLMTRPYVHSIRRHRHQRGH